MLGKKLEREKIIDTNFFSNLKIECAIRREKSAFDHINMDWNLPHDDGSTDFSDDDTVIDERVSFNFLLIFFCLKLNFL